MSFNFFPGEEESIVGSFYLKDPQAPRYLHEFEQAGFTHEEALALTGLSVECSQRVVKQQLYQLDGQGPVAADEDQIEAEIQRPTPIDSAIARTLNEER